jgi:hypothetical protein
VKVVTTTVSRTPSNVVAPGRNKAAEINRKIARLAAGASADHQETLLLLAGIHTLEAPIVAASHVILTGEGDDTILVPTFTGDADDPTNAVILAVGEVDTDTLDTTLTAPALKGAMAVALTSAGSIAAGDHLVIEGFNGEDDELGGELEEVVEVAASYTSGLSIPLVWATYQHHSGEAVTVRAIAPVVGFRVRDLQIRGSIGDGVITACGIYAKQSLDLEFHGISASGCARAAIDVEGCSRWASSGFYNRGGSNAWYYLGSTSGFEVAGFNGSDRGDRIHPDGVPRFQIVMGRRCTDGRIHDGTLRHGNGGLFHGGGVNLSFNSIHIRDQEVTEASYARWIASGEQEHGGTVGLGFGSGASVIGQGFDEWAVGCQYADITVEDLRAPNVTGWNDVSPRRACAAYIHDSRRLTMTNIVCANWVNSNLVGGVIISDADGSLTNLTVKGMPIGIALANFEVGLRIRNYRFDGARGGSPVAPVPLYVNNDATGNGSFWIDNFFCSSAFSFVTFGPGFVYDARFTIRDLHTEQGRWAYAVVAYNATGVAFTVGDIVEIDPTHTGTDLRVRTPDTNAADYGGRLAVVVSGLPDDPGTGFIMIAPLPQEYASVTASAAAVAYGDRLAYAATRRAAASPGATQPIGVALARKSAGSEGLLLIGRAA